jgi:hypothetical protein
MIVVLKITGMRSWSRCETCHKRAADHRISNHEFKSDGRIPEWHGWHAARRGLASNLYRLVCLIW